MPSSFLHKLGGRICGESGIVWRDAEMNSSVNLNSEDKWVKGQEPPFVGCHLILLLSYTAGTVLSTLPVDLHLVTILWADHAICQAFFLKSISQCFFALSSLKESKLWNSISMSLLKWLPASSVSGSHVWETGGQEKGVPLVFLPVAPPVSVVPYLFWDIFPTGWK